MTIRVVLSAIALGFALYQAARGLIWTTAVPDSPGLLVVAVAIYVATTVFSILVVSRPQPGRPIVREPMPRWAALVVLLSAAVIPSLTGFAALSQRDVLPTYATWYVGGLGAVMVVLMVRRRPVIAWAGVVLLTAGAMIWMGPVRALGQGLVGSIVWVGVAQLLVILIRRAERDAAQLAELQTMTSAWEAGQEARERERRVQLQRALGVGGPILARVIAMHGALTDAERREAGLAEARLRDELRGPLLLDDDVRAAIEAARRRGAQVSVFDEGGLDELDENDLVLVRRELAATVRGASSDRLIIRTSPHERVVITVVGKSCPRDKDESHAETHGSADEAGESVVDLWREIEHPHSADTAER